MNRTLAAISFGTSLVVLAASAIAQGIGDSGPSWDRDIQPLVSRHCYRCHGNDETHGDVDLRKDENPRLILRNRKTWEAVADVLRSNEMPPEDARHLDPDDREKIITFLDITLGQIDCTTLRDPGTPAARRLTRHEYNLAVEDLTGLPIRPGNDFPPEPISFGFAGIGSASGLTPVDVNHYHVAAESIADAIVLAAETDETIKEHFFGIDDTPPPKAAFTLLARFADRAFRRPTDEAFLAGLNQVYLRSIEQASDHTEAMRNAMSAVLMSPRFFMRIETPPDGEPEETAYPVDGWDLASRLSFFLWAAPPDEDLRKLAESGQILEPEVLQGQASRMLKSNRVADGLVRGFFAQWLQLRSLSTHQVDATLFPEATVSLRRSMRREVERLLIEIVRKDRPITEIIDANYSFVDERLASFYGLPSQVDAGFHRVALPDRRRGGVVVSAALLTLQSDPGRTNVPRRGNYIAGTFFGDPPPPPPPDVPALVTDDADTKSLTLRELLEMHRADPQCAACHAKMDPIGFALENYDAIGRWRTHDAGQPIDASGELPKSGVFVGPEGLKDLLLSRKEDFAKTLAENLLIYALGRGHREVDPCVIDDALESLEANDDRFSSLVIAIVKSFPFTHRSDPAF
ncbi:hypothetical protein Poly51_51360 [Rubripirellula tenax]|uniref:Planctomycete cytochrome C n=1 Tax=Rubripirellula tenax TaxID=2528015 RepID=A0A5C6EI68_9BACT|nr:DUF1592 domain-containing protein [Rubripirellula tenax]TWU47336.1 hypothetical protein Poly51_51360 [Rubripirellula tenax]